MGKRKLTDNDMEVIIERYKNGETSTSICKDYNVVSTTILNNLRRYNIPIRSLSEAFRKYSLNESAFSKLTVDSAYWLGFLFADGSMVNRAKRQWYISMNLQAQDRNHLLKFADFLHSDMVVRKCNRSTWTSWEFGVYSDTMAEDLLKFGMRQNKKVRGVELHDALYYNRHFWRGMIDGDGSIYRRGEARNNIITISLSGHKTLIKPFNNFVYLLLGKRNKISDYKSYQRIEYCGNGAKVLIRELYGGSTIYLDRKYEKIKGMI